MIKCYNQDCNNMIDFDLTGSAYCSDECHDKCWAKQEAKRIKKYKFADGSLFARCKELALEAKEERLKNFGVSKAVSPYEALAAEFNTPGFGFDNSAPLFHN